VKTSWMARPDSHRGHHDFQSSRITIRGVEIPGKQAVLGVAWALAHVRSLRPFHRDSGDERVARPVGRLGFVVVCWTRRFARFACSGLTSAERGDGQHVGVDAVEECGVALVGDALGFGVRECV
jgi:hypothetical protein